MNEMTLLKQKTGDVYIFDFAEKNILSAVLLHDVPFKINQADDWCVFRSKRTVNPVLFEH